MMKDERFGPVRPKKVEAGYNGNTEPKLIFAGGLWDEWPEQPFCIHGEKLRWQCDYCLEVCGV